MKSIYIPRGCDQQGRYQPGFVRWRRYRLRDMLADIKHALLAGYREWLRLRALRTGINPDDCEW